MPKTIIILSASSDIGRYLAERYLDAGDTVIGTYRDRDHVKVLEGRPNCHLFYCDINGRKSLDLFLSEMLKLNLVWDTFISCVGYPLPLVPFFESNFDEWKESVEINSLDQLRVVHALYPLRNKDGKTNIVFFAGGGMNSAPVNFSAYTVSKILLTKMCELIHADHPELNPFIVGPGWTKTKIHQTIIEDERTPEAKVTETKEFLDQKEGTALEDIYACVEWLCAEPQISAGRNFSVVYDPWRTELREQLKQQLMKDADMYKLRRSGNDFKQNKRKK